MLAVIGGRLLLRVGYRPTSIVGFALLTLGFVLLSTYGRGDARAWLYLALILIGAGLGLTMLTLLIAVQQAVSREQLGVATSLNQFSRSIGGAFGVAVMGAVLSAGLAARLDEVARRPGSALTPVRAAELAANPNALIDPQARDALAPEARDALQGALADAMHTVFWTGTVLAALALLVSFYLPREGERGGEPPDENSCTPEAGERMMMAELTTIAPEHEPVAARNKG